MLIDGAGRKVSPNASAIHKALNGDTSMVQTASENLRICFDEDNQEIDIVKNGNNVTKYYDLEFTEAIMEFLELYMEDPD